ncbi:MAG TPA: hypothetical protein VN715_13290 [Roseiarcus sp.]|nr:hypothetical protein [Roseiarcus sp.]
MSRSAAIAASRSSSLNADYALYRDWLAQACTKYGVEVWAYCHLVLVPADAAGLGLAMARAHRFYAGFVNARARQTGPLFQGRFGSVAMDEEHLIAAVRYIALNPVRAARTPRRGLAALERRRAFARQRR